MLIKKINVEKIFNGKEFLFNQSVFIENEKIINIKSCSPECTVEKGLLIPGYIDIQVNGGGGFLFNESPTLQTIKKIGEAHQLFGTTGWLPTLITDSIDKMLQASDAVAEAIRTNLPGVLGIHFEGPFLSKEKKGVHSESYIRKISADELAILKRKDLGKVLVTLAPENVSTDKIKNLVDSGLIVSLGHSNATFDQVNIAIEAGATGFTHLFNAMSAFTSREPGMVGAAILAKNCYSGIILDGIHVNPESARLAYHTNKKLMLVTDAMPPVGTNQTSFNLFGGKVIRDGLTLTDSIGRLAGSALDMHSAVSNAEKMLRIEKSEAVNLASKNPAEFLGLDHLYGTLAIGYKASMLLLDNNGQILSSWIDGKQIR